MGLTVSGKGSVIGTLDLSSMMKHVVVEQEGKINIFIDRDGNRYENIIAPSSERDPIVIIDGKMPAHYRSISDRNVRDAPVKHRAATGNRAATANRDGTPEESESSEKNESHESLDAQKKRGPQMRQRYEQWKKERNVSSSQK